MKQWLVVAVVALAGGCRGGGTKTKRTGSAAPVEVVDEPQLADAGHGPGPNSDEIEPNDGEEVATPLALGGTARGKIDPDSDVDFYRVELDRPGVLQVVLSGVDDMDLVLELTDDAGNTLARSDRGGFRTKEGLPNVGLTRGAYMVVVKQLKHKPPRKRGRKRAKEPEPPAVVPVYELTAQLISSGPGAGPGPSISGLGKGGEREPDDDRGTANDLIIGDNATGFIGWSGDEDVWKLSVETLSDKNLLDVELSAIEGVALELSIADGLGRPLATRKAPRGAPVSLVGVMPSVPPGGSPYHYLTVRADRSNPETAYTLHASARLAGLDEEIEPNDDPGKPYMMPVDRTIVHAAWAPGDVDCFGLAPAGTARQIDVSVATPAELNLDAELLVDGKPVAVADKGGKGVSEKLTGLAPASTRPVICVRNPVASAKIEAKYDVSIQESTATEDNVP